MCEKETVFAQSQRAIVASQIGRRFADGTRSFVGRLRWEGRTSRMMVPTEGQRLLG